MPNPFNPNPYPATAGDTGPVPGTSPSGGSPVPGVTPGGVAPIAKGSQDVFGLGAVGDTTQVLLGWTDNLHQSGSRYSVDGGPGTGTTTHTTTANRVTANQYLQNFANMSLSNKAGFIALQQQLIAAHAYGSGKPVIGVYTAADANAMAAIMTGYVGLVNSNPGGGNALKFSDYLQMVIKGGGLGGGGGGGPTRAPLQLTDPKTLKESLQQAAQNRLGRNLNDAEVATFTDAFHGAERSAYNAAGAGKTVTGPDVSGRSLAQVDENHQAEEGQRNMATNLDALASLLGAK